MWPAPGGPEASLELRRLFDAIECEAESALAHPRSTRAARGRIVAAFSIAAPRRDIRGRIHAVLGHTLPRASSSGSVAGWHRWREIEPLY